MTSRCLFKAIRNRSADILIPTKMVVNTNSRFNSITKSIAIVSLIRIAFDMLRLNAIKQDIDIMLTSGDIIISRKATEMDMSTPYLMCGILFLLSVVLFAKNNIRGLLFYSIFIVLITLYEMNVFWFEAFELPLTIIISILCLFGFFSYKKESKNSEDEIEIPKERISKSMRINLPYKKMGIVIGVLLLVLIITNPSLKNFKEYVGIEGATSFKLKKNANFLIFSVYQSDLIGYGVRSGKYIGIFENFIKIG